MDTTPISSPNDDTTYVPRPTEPIYSDRQVPTYRTPDPMTVTPAPRGPRTGTIIFGLIALLVGVFMIALTAGLQVDSELVVISFFALGGVALLGGALGSIRRSPR